MTRPTLQREFVCLSELSAAARERALTLFDIGDLAGEFGPGGRLYFVASELRAWSIGVERTGR